MVREEELVQKAKEVREALIEMAADEVDATHIEVGQIKAKDDTRKLLTVRVGGANRYVPYQGHDTSEFTVGDYWAIIFDDYGTIRLGWWVTNNAGGGTIPFRPHNLLDGDAHPDTVAQGATRGSVIVGDSTPEWNEVTIGAANRIFLSDGADAGWGQADHGAALVGLLDDDHTIYFLADCTRAFGGDPIPDGVDTRSLGSPTAEWLNLYMGVAGKIYFRLDQTVNLYSDIAGTLRTDDDFRCNTIRIMGAGGRFNAQDATAVGTIRFQSSAVGDTQMRFIIYAGGLHTWGPGNAAQDVSLYRVGANLLGLGAGNNFRFPTTSQAQFRDTAIYIASLDDGFLDLVADTAIRLDGNTLYVDTVNNRVGIGEPTPSTLLHLVADNLEPLRLERTTDGYPGIALYRNNATADGNPVGFWTFKGQDSGGAETEYSFIEAGAVDVSDGTEDGYLRFATMRAGAVTEGMRINESGDVIPGPAGTPGGNLGIAASYWNDISYKTLTDRGCLFSADEGVEMMDGRMLSDMEALLAIKIHKDKLSVHGLPALDYATMPKAVYSPAPIANRNIEEIRDEITGEVIQKAYKKGEKMGDDGSELTALISIMLGGQKELHHRLLALEAA